MDLRKDPRKHTYLSEKEVGKRMCAKSFSRARLENSVFLKRAERARELAYEWPDMEIDHGGRDIGQGAVDENPFIGEQ